MLAPGLLSGHDVGADGLVLDEEPSLVHQERLEGRQFLRVRNLVAGSVEHIEKQRLQHFGSITPAGEVERLEAGEAERVFYIVEEESILSLLGPAVQPLLQFADDLAESRERPLLRRDDVHPFDGLPQFALLFEVKPVTFVVTLDQHTEERKEKLQVLLRLRETERVDG